MRNLKVLFFLCFFLFAGCEKHMVIVNNVGEREANEIVVYLASKGIPAGKVETPTTGPAAGAKTEEIFSIAVDQKQAVEAMAILNNIGLPRLKSPTLLELFPKSGLVSSTMEENIRYQAGLATQIAGTIRKIDGVIDAVVEISIPQEETLLPGTEATERPRATASVFVKHQGVMDDPNTHLVSKIKRLVAASISELDINDVTVISDVSRFTNVSIGGVGEEITPKAKEYVSIWSIVMSKGSAARFRVIFFFLIVAMIAFALLVAWLFWKFYPMIREKGFKGLLSPAPFKTEVPKEEEPPPPPPAE